MTRHACSVREDPAAVVRRCASARRTNQADDLPHGIRICHPRGLLRISDKHVDNRSVRVTACAWWKILSGAPPSANVVQIRSVLIKRLVPHATCGARDAPTVCMAGNSRGVVNKGRNTA